MGILDGVSDLTFTNPKAIFEKTCLDYLCYSLDDISNNTKVKAKIIDKENFKIQFSGNVNVETKKISGRKFFVDNQNRILELVPNTIEFKDEEIQQKTKTSKHETTISNFTYKSLDLK